MFELYISHINIRSLLTGLAELKHTILSCNYDICLVSETWLKGSGGEQIANIPHYAFVRKNMAGSKRGGGVGMYIKLKYKYSIIDVYSN